MARRAVLLAVVLLGATVAGEAAPAVAAGPSIAGLWSVTRTPDGALHVVRGAEAAAARLDARLGRSATTVLTTEQDRPVRQLGDPLRRDQWALDRVPYEATWGAARGAGVRVAVVDTGVLASHEDLAGSVVPGTDLASDAARVDPGRTGMVDPAGHGTHVAGIIAAHAHNGRGVSGAAPGVRIVPVRVLDARGTGVASNVALGIIWAADHGARVINLSLGGGESPGEQVAMQYAISRGAVVVAAAGNQRLDGNRPVYPAAYPEAIAVAAVTSALGHAAFSNTGGYVDLAAPGDGVISTYGAHRADYEWMSGTSMASPHVAAAAALVISRNWGLSSARVASIVQSTANDLGPPGRDSAFGMGLVNPRAAVLAATPNLNSGAQGDGYWIVSADGRVRPFGRARSYGDLGAKPHSGRIVAGARMPDGRGYLLAGSDGAVYAFGSARYHGGMFGRHLNGPIVGIAATPTGRGYVLLGRDGGIFTFGDARFFGSTGNRRLNAPVLDMTLTPDGRGYWLVAGDGGIFTFGNARFRGSTGNMRLSEPVRSMAASGVGKGYWMVASDGGVFAFGVPFKGSLPGVRGLISRPVPSIRMRAVPSDDGYYILRADGSVFAFGAAKYWGGAPGVRAVDLMQLPG